MSLGSIFDLIVMHFLVSLAMFTVMEYSYSLSWRTLDLGHVLRDQDVRRLVEIVLHRVPGSFHLGVYLYVRVARFRKHQIFFFFFLRGRILFANILFVVIAWLKEGYTSTNSNIIS